MNAISIKERVDFYNNLTKAARFLFSEYNIAFNNAIQQFIDDKMGDEQQRMPENFQWIQSVRDDLYTLIKTSSPTLTDGTLVTTEYYSSIPTTFPFPTDYYDFITLRHIISGKTTFSRPTDYNSDIPLLENSFKHPTNKKTYYNENATGMTIWRGDTGTMTSAQFTYLKTPATFTIGTEANLINATATLTNALVYYATEISVYNGTTYAVGASITGNGTVGGLTSGQVILSTNTTTTDLPERVQDDLCKKCSVIMLKSIGMYDEAAAAESQISK